MLEQLPHCEILHGDKGYDANAIRRQVEERGAMPNIPPKANRKWKNCFSPVLYRNRNAIERMRGFPNRDRSDLTCRLSRRPAGMASAYAQDLRNRVIDAVVRGGMSRRAAAARFGVSDASAIKWVRRFARIGSRSAAKMGGCLRPKLEPHREFLEALRSERADITLKALCDRLLADRGVKAGASMMSRFFRRIGVTLKKRRSSRASRIGRT